MQIMTGMLEAKRKDKTIAVILDADLSDDPANIPQSVDPILEGSKDFVLSCRTKKRSKNLEPRRDFGNHLAVWLMKQVIDYQ